MAAAGCPDAVAEAGVLLAVWLAEVTDAMTEDGMSQQQLAGMSGVGLRTVSRILGGGAWPELTTLVAITAATRTALPGAHEALEPVSGWPRCAACDEALHGQDDPNPRAAFAVHGQLWSGLHCRWTDALTGAGYSPWWPPEAGARWP